MRNIPGTTKSPFGASANAFCLAAIAAHLVLRFGLRTSVPTSNLPLLAAITLGGTPLLYDLLRKLLRREFGSDLLGGIAMLTSVWLGEYWPVQSSC